VGGGWSVWSERARRGKPRRAGERQTHSCERPRGVARRVGRREGGGGEKKEEAERRGGRVARRSGVKEGKRVRAGTPRANHSRRLANNLLVFRIRFDSLSFRYLYLSDLLLRGFRGFRAANEREGRGRGGRVGRASNVGRAFLQPRRAPVRRSHSRDRFISIPLSGRHVTRAATRRSVEGGGN